MAYQSCRHFQPREKMIGQRHCPLCETPALRGCAHLALAVEGRDFVRRCVEECQGQIQWQALCKNRRGPSHRAGDWTPERDDFMWLETAFCNEFLKRLRWFGGMDYEWRTGPKPGQGGFCVLLWSKDPQRLWWELRDEFERQSSIDPSTPQPQSWTLTPEFPSRIPQPSNPPPDPSFPNPPRFNPV